MKKLHNFNINTKESQNAYSKEKSKKLSATLRQGVRENEKPLHQGGVYHEPEIRLERYLRFSRRSTPRCGEPERWRAWESRG